MLDIIVVQIRRISPYPCPQLLLIILPSFLVPHMIILDLSFLTFMGLKFSLFFLHGVRVLLVDLAVLVHIWSYFWQDLIVCLRIHIAWTRRRRLTLLHCVSLKILWVQATDKSIFIYLFGFVNQSISDHEIRRLWTPLIFLQHRLAILDGRWPSSVVCVGSIHLLSVHNLLDLVESCDLTADSVSVLVFIWRNRIVSLDAGILFIIAIVIQVVVAALMGNVVIHVLHLLLLISNILTVIPFEFGAVKLIAFMFLYFYLIMFISVSVTWNGEVEEATAARCKKWIWNTTILPPYWFYIWNVSSTVFQVVFERIHI